MAVAAACARARLAGEPTPIGKRTAWVLAGYRQTGGDRGEATRARSGSPVVALPGPWPDDGCYRAASLCRGAVEILEEARRLGIDSTGAASATMVFPSRRCKAIREATLSGLIRQLGIGRCRTVSSPASGIGRPSGPTTPVFPARFRWAAGTFHTSASRSISSHRREPCLPRAGRGQRSSRWRGSTPRVVHRTAVRSSCSRNPRCPRRHWLGRRSAQATRRWLARRERPRDENTGSSESLTVCARNWGQLQLARRVLNQRANALGRACGRDRVESATAVG